MSLPKHSTTFSPSTQSPRQVPRDSPASPAPPAPKPATEQPTQDPAAETHSQDDPSHDTAPAPSDQQQKEQQQQEQQQPPFQPFFTLIEDAHSSEYFHPTVHYIFSDDDTDIVTEAALRSMENEQESSGTNKDPPRRDRDQTHDRDQSQSEEVDRTSGPPSPSAQKEPLLPPPIRGVRDNYIILDVEPRSFDTPSTTAAGPGTGTGTRSLSTSPATATQPPQQPHQHQQQYTVTSAQSLSPTWQILETQLLPAPTFENNSPDEQPVNEGLMLKIHGTPGVPLPGNMNIAREKEKEKGSQRLEEMMDQFAKRMGELQRVIEAGDQEVPTKPGDGDGDGEGDPVEKQEPVDEGVGEGELAGQTR